MKNELFVTELTRMYGDRVCVAGYVRNLGCVRPVFRRGDLTEAWLKIGPAAIIRPFAVVELELLENTPESPHTEDWVIDPTYRVVKRMVTQDQRREILKTTDYGGVEYVFGAPIHRGPGWYIEKGQGQRSLGTIVPAEISQVRYGPNDYGDWDYRISFTDQLRQSYRLTVTDLAFRYFLDHQLARGRLSTDEVARRILARLRQTEVFLRIGLARRWSRFPDRCFLQITGVYSFPDYLNGRCFADLALSPEELAEHRR